MQLRQPRIIAAEPLEVMNRYLRCHPFCDGATDPTIADRHPSLRYLAPGELMLDTLLVEVEAENTVDGEPTE